MYSVYILQSLVNGSYYIGQTNDISARLKRHNAGNVKFTSKYKPWKLVHLEKYVTRSTACLRELEIKNYKGGIKFKKLVGIWLDNL